MDIGFNASPALKLSHTWCAFALDWGFFIVVLSLAPEGMVATGFCVLCNCLWQQNAVKGLEYPELGTQPQGKRDPWTTWSLH